MVGHEGQINQMTRFDYDFHPHALHHINSQKAIL